MRRGTTPTLTFDFEIDTSLFVSGFITIVSGETTINIDINDCDLIGTTASYTLTQTDTLSLSANAKDMCKIQAKVKTVDEKVLASPIITRKVDDILNEVILE